MNYAELTRKLRDLESEISDFRALIAHEQKWDAAKSEIDRNREVRADTADLLAPLTVRDLNPDAKFVEQVELFHHDERPEYHVRFRYDDDSTEKMGIFTIYEAAYDYAREQARRYHMPIFDTTYEDLVD